MLIIGELINSSRKTIREAVENEDALFIQKLAKEQVEAGADMLDINAGTFYKKEPQKLKWLVEVVNKAVDSPICIDSPNPEALKAALECCRGKKVMINSITAEEKRFSEIVPLVKEFSADVVALTIDKGGIPHDVEKRMEIAGDLVKKLLDEGIDEDRIFIDPLVEPISTSDANGVTALETIRQLSGWNRKVKIICALSNISFGLPGRKLMNQSFAAMAAAAGLNAAILNPCDRHLMGMLKASMTIANRDPYCKEYIKAYKKGFIQ